MIASSICVSLRTRAVSLVLWAGLLTAGAGLIGPAWAADDAVVAPAQPGLYQGAPAKYVIFFIGDGMGLAQRMSADLYLDAMEARMPQPGVMRLAMNRLPAQGLVTTFGPDTMVTDSAAAGTALATGNKTAAGVLGLDVTRQNELASLADLAKRSGRKVGVVSTASLDHATPAAFYAHVTRRGDYYTIARQLAACKIDFFGGGGLLYPQGKDGKRPDVMADIKAAGFTVRRTAAEIMALQPGDGRVLAIHPSLDSEMSVAFEIDRQPEDPSLADLTRKAIQCLEDCPNGFFLMVEGGKIDWACHVNDAATSVRETIALDQAVQEAMKFYDKHKAQTLIVITADHETGGMSLGYTGTGYKLHLDRLGRQRMSLDALSKKVADYRKTRTLEAARFEELLPLLEEATGLVPMTPERKVAADRAMAFMMTPAELDAMKRAFDASMKKLTPRPGTEPVDATSYHPYISYGGKEPFAAEAVRIVSRKAGISWGTYAHTGIPVPVSAVGVGQETFLGFYDNTHVQQKIAAVLGVKSAEMHVKSAEQQAGR